MRRVLGLLAMTVALTMAMGARGMRAQMVDPTTGMMVDPASDPTDYVNLVTGQPTNPSLEAIVQMNAQQSAQQAAQQQTDFQDFMNSSSANDNTPSKQPSVAVTPKPKITPKGGKFTGSVEVAIGDSDAGAMLHYTTDGSKPTASSPLYIEPFAVKANTKVRVVAMDGSERPSGVVTAKFKVKS